MGWGLPAQQCLHHTEPLLGVEGQAVRQESTRAGAQPLDVEMRFCMRPARSHSGFFQASLTAPGPGRNHG